MERMSSIGDRVTATSTRVEEESASISASEAREVSEVSDEARKPAMTGFADSHSPALRLLPPTPPQSLYPRSSCKMLQLSSSDAATSATTSAATIEDRVESGDRYKGDAFIRHRRHRGALRAAEHPCQRPGQGPWKTRTDTDTGTETETERFASKTANNRFEQGGQSQYRQYPVEGSLRRFGMRPDDDDDDDDDDSDGNSINSSITINSSSVDLAAYRGNTERKASSMHWKAREVTRRELDAEERMKGKDVDVARARGQDERDERDEREGHGPEEGQRQENSRVGQIAAGLLWVQKHPVLAAVMWVCGKVLVPAGEDECEDKVSDGEDEKAPQTSPIRASDRNSNPFRRDGSSLRDLTQHASGSGRCLEMKVKGQAYPSALGRRPSKGRLSWSDDFGGCLAEYYEDDRVASSPNSSRHTCNATNDAMLVRQREDASVSGEDFGFLPHTSASPSPPGGVAGVKISTMGTSHSGGGGTWSPQWGWYVNTTPPQDMYPNHQTPTAARKPASSSNGGNEDVSPLSGRPPKP